jgi:predicted DNA-binding protein (MmcQ/YjbR family)
VPSHLTGRDPAERAFERLRRLCLAFPETTETTAFGHPNFVAGKKAFVTFERVEGRPSVAFRQAPGDVDILLGQPGFFATPYGRGVWVSRWVDSRLEWPHVVELVERAYRLVALQRMIAALDAGQ